MRTSVLPDDLGCVNFVHGQRVLLDGKDITEDCQTADEELGEVRVLKCNEEGEHYYDKLTDEVPWETLTGKVEIKEVFTPTIKVYGEVIVELGGKRYLINAPEGVTIRERNDVDN